MLRHLTAIVVLLIIAGCSGGGCGGGGCSSCGGVTPLPDGFKADARIENAGAVRLTDSGLTFLEQNLGPLAKSLLGGSGNGGILTFPIPATSGSQLGIDYDVCPGGPDPNANPPKCIAEIDVGNAQLAIDPANPHNIKITGPLPIRIQNLPIKIVYLFIPDSATAVLTGNGCTKPGNFKNVNLDVDISIEVDQNQAHSRHGYSRVKVNKLAINESQLKDGLGFCGGGFSNFVLGVLKDVLFGQLVGPLIGTLQEQVDQQLCQQANPMLNPTCPTGTNDINGVCRYGTTENDECASIILGTDGHVNLGGLLASISPGTKGGLDFLFAVGGAGKRDDSSGFAWGDLNPVAGGATLGMYGGAEPTPVSKCVKFSDLALPTGIPIPTELVSNTVQDWPANVPGPHVGIALSERFANYAMNGIYNSGMLCIGITTENVDMLNSGTIGLLASSSKDLGLQREAQQIALVVRPNAPPTVAFGNGTDIDTDPTIRVGLKQASFDFYTFSLDRFIRFMTTTYDLDIPVNLVVTPDGLTPVLKKIGVSNGKVTNNELLREDPNVIASAIGDLIASQVGQAVGGGISPIDLNGALSSLGMTLIIPDSVDGQGSPGLRKLSKGSDNYLGIFASLGIAQQMPLKQADTTASLVSKDVDPAGLKFTTINKSNAPMARLELGSTLDNGQKAIEYSYRVDQGFWHPFSRDRYLDVQDDWLRVQGKHTIFVRSRVAGEPMSLDPTPAAVEVIVDIEAPVIEVGTVDDENQAAVVITDKVSGEKTLVRYQLDKDAFSAWQPASAIARLDVGDAAEITVEAKDEEGNVSTATLPLIRGRAVADGAGCGCAVVGGDRTPSHAVWMLAVAIAGIGARLFRARRAGAAKPVPPRARAASAARRTLGGFAAIAIASSWAGCNCGTDTDPTTTSSGGDCPDCISLAPGLIGAYTSAVSSSGTIWVAGYAEANWDEGYTWGDLVVGKWNGSKVDWQTVDGVPSEPEVDPKAYDTGGFRGGQTDPGEDVGLWTSIALDSAGNPAVAYYDRTNRALKLAHFDGTAWNISTVDSKAGADIGRYAKLLATGGRFVLAYQTIASGGDNGALMSTVRVATSVGDKPGALSWTFEDAVVDKNTPCRAQFCESGTACIASTLLCMPTLKADQCNPACASAAACVDMQGTISCEDKLSSAKIDAYPDAIGGYISLAENPKGGVGIAFYDRVRGNVVVANNNGGKWTSMIVDGEDAMGQDTGDVGIGTTLFIDQSNDWHVAYVDGIDEAVRYVKITGGTTVGTPELVDDGLSVGGQVFPDGRHIVGDDASIFVSPSGEVRISYQDATAGTLRYAMGTPGSGSHNWSVKAVQQTGFAGAFSKVIEADGKIQLVNWWRVGGATVEGDVAIVSP